MSLIEGFWWLMSMAAIIWFSTITAIVAVRGAGDIRQMFARLEAMRQQDAAEGQDPAPPDVP